MSIVVAVSMGLLNALDSSRRLVTVAEMRDTAGSVAQGEVERIETLPWASVALASEPVKNVGAGTTDPTYYISSGPCAGSSKTSQHVALLPVGLEQQLESRASGHLFVDHRQHLKPQPLE